VKPFPPEPQQPSGSFSSWRDDSLLCTLEKEEIMPAPKLTLTMTHGCLEKKRFVFKAPAQCVIGRAEDCTIRLPMDGLHQDVSRHHCILDVDPSGVWVGDLGSRNGTYVNGIIIGQRPPEQPPEDSDPRAFMAHELHEGDEIRVGSTVFRLGPVVTSPPQPSEDGTLAILGPRSRS
jgi:eukaryotic-like serine/threonine-protein kinase